MRKFTCLIAEPRELRICALFNAVLSATKHVALVLPLVSVVSGVAFAQSAAPDAAAVPFPDAVANAARTLFKAVPLPEGNGKVEIVIDPLLDGRTGTHTKAAAQAGQLIAAVARREFPRLTIVEFTHEALARKPLLLIGTIRGLQDVGQDAAAKTPAQNLAQSTTPPQKPEQPASPGVPGAYQVWFTLADTQSREVVAKGRAVASGDGINTTPVPVQADSPVWLRDPAVQAYLESCEKTKVGEQLAQTYSDQIEVSAVLAQADQLYAGGQAQKALALYRQAAELPNGAQLRVLNGIYVSLDRLRKKKDAAQAFGDLVDYGLQSQDLAVKILFRPGTTQFAKAREAADYPMWLRQIATKGSARQACLEVIGHTSPTGPAAINDRLSQLRAEAIRSTLEQDARGLGSRIIARGMGSRENIVGTGKDDATDALDRRVEFKVIGCS